MAFKRLNSLRLIDEYCCKPQGKKCPITETCYDDQYQCMYWKQIFKNPTEEGLVIRKGNSWYNK